MWVGDYAELAEPLINIPCFCLIHMYKVTVQLLIQFVFIQTQLRLEAFYTFNERFAKIRSQRIKKAVKGITGKSSAELMDDIAQASSSGKKRGGKSSALDEHKPEHCSEVKDNITGKASRKPKRQKTESLLSESGVGDMLTPEEGRRINKNDLAANSRGRRGRVRGRRRGRGRGKEEELNNDSTKSSSSDDCSDKGEMEKHIQVSEPASALRRVSLKPFLYVICVELGQEFCLVF